MSVLSLSIIINDKIRLIAYVRGSKLPKKGPKWSNFEIVGDFWGPKLPYGRRILKKWLLIIKLHGLSSNFGPKNGSNGSIYQ